MVSPLRTVVCRRWPVPSQYEYVIFSGSFFSSCGSQEHSFSHMRHATLLSRVKDVNSRKDTLRRNPAEQYPGLEWHSKETRLHGQQVVEGKAAFPASIEAPSLHRRAHAVSRCVPRCLPGADLPVGAAHTRA